MQHANEGGLSSPVLAQHYQDLRISELSSLHVQREAALSLGHGRVAIVAEPLRTRVNLCGRLRHLQGQSKCMCIVMRALMRT